jgi:hypothetical protein
LFLLIWAHNLTLTCYICVYDEQRIRRGQFSKNRKKRTVLKLFLKLSFYDSSFKTIIVINTFTSELFKLHHTFLFFHCPLDQKFFETYGVILNYFRNLHRSGNHSHSVPNILGILFNTLEIWKTQYCHRHSVCSKTLIYKVNETMDS